MPSSLKSVVEFEALLNKARVELEHMVKAEPTDGAIGSVQHQLEMLHGWTRNGRRPEQSEKDQLNFGHIASRELDSYAIARDLYKLSSFVIYWDDVTPQTKP